MALYRRQPSNNAEATGLRGIDRAGGIAALARRELLEVDAVGDHHHLLRRNKSLPGKAIGVGLIDGPATMIVRRVDREHDCLILAPGNGSAAHGASSSTRELRVHSACDGELIVTVAIGERHTHAKS